MTSNSASAALAEGVLIEAEDCDGWIPDSQFEALIGSPCLLAQGLGEPV